MKFLFDENLSETLIRSFADRYPSSTSVIRIGTPPISDKTSWEYARANNFVIVTKDGDFQQRAFLEGLPPKVIWIRAGNCSTEEIKSLLFGSAEKIKVFGEDKEAALLVLP